MPTNHLTPEELAEQAELDAALANPAPFSYDVAPPQRTSQDPDQMLKGIGLDRAQMEKAMEFARQRAGGARGEERIMAAGDRLGAAIAGQKYDEGRWDQRIAQAGAGPVDAEKEQQGKAFAYAKLIAEGRQEEAQAFLKSQGNWEKGRADAAETHAKGLADKVKRRRELGDKASDEQRREAARRDSQTFTAGQGELNRAATLEAAGITDKREDTKRFDEDLKDLEKRLPPGAAGFYDQISNIERIIAKSPKGDIPGVGFFDSRKPGWLQSSEGKEMQKYARQMMLAYRNLVTGTGGSEQEMAQIDKAGAELTNEDSFRQGLSALKSGYDARLKQVMGGYRPEVGNAYAKRVPGLQPTEPPGGKDLSSPPARPPPGTTKQIGGKTFVVGDDNEWHEKG